MNSSTVLGFLLPFALIVSCYLRALSLWMKERERERDSERGKIAGNLNPVNPRPSGVSIRCPCALESVYFLKSADQADQVATSS